MKSLVFSALLSVCLVTAAFAETEDEARVELQSTLIKLEAVYSTELLPEEQRQLSFLIDWADRYSECEEWIQFAKDFSQCHDSTTLSNLLNKDYININQAPKNLMQREEIQQRSIEIVQTAGFNLDQMPYVSLGCKGGSHGWEVIVSQIPGDEQRTPGINLDLSNNGFIRYMEYRGEPTMSVDDARISKQKAQEIALTFMDQYVDIKGNATYAIKQETSHWQITYEWQDNQQPCEIWIDNKTGAVLLVETFTR